MRIENHRLLSATPDFKPEYQADEWGGPLKAEILVIHYGVTHTAGVTAAVLKAREYASSHLTIDSKGRTIQQVPFDRVAYHAGASAYRGRKDCNKFALGIEVSNPGPLLKQPDGSFRDVNGHAWSGGVVEAWHPNDKHKQGWKYWAEYSQTELDLCAHIGELLRLEYGLTDVVGHDEIAPGRKSDPGPAFPMAWLRETLFPMTKRDTIPDTEP